METTPQATEELAKLQASVTVAGRKFNAVTNTTFKQDMLIMQILHEAGLRELAEKFDVLKDDLGAVAENVIIAAYKSGKLFELLGAVMIEEGQPWTTESAKTNSEFFANLTSSEDKQALKGSIVAVILGFFVSGLFVSRTSQISLKHRNPAVPGEGESPVIEESLASETGALSSGS